MFYRSLILLFLFFIAHQASFASGEWMGGLAPYFRLPDQNGEYHSLSDYQGQWLVLYFYPKNNTPGCTKEARHFAELKDEFSQYNASIVGVSLDSVESHQKFVGKLELPFPLLSDANKEVAKAYDTLAGFGPFSFAKRHTFLIDPDGHITYRYTDIDAEAHAKEVLQDLIQLQSRQDRSENPIAN